MTTLWIKELDVILSASPTIIPEVIIQHWFELKGKDGGLSTCEYGEDRLMHRLDLFLLQHVTREEGYNHEHDQDEQGK